MAEDPKVRADDPETGELREVARVWAETEAEIIKGFLESQGISCYFRSQILHSIYPIFVDGLGEIKIYVHQKDFETASELLKNPGFVPENPT